MSEGEIDPTASVFLEHATSGTETRRVRGRGRSIYGDGGRLRTWSNVRAVIDVAMNGEFDTRVGGGNHV